MAWRRARQAIFLTIITLLASCGDQNLLMSLRREGSDIKVNSLPNGRVLTVGQPLPLNITAQDTGKLKDLEIEVTLTSPTGEKAWHDRRAVPALNEDFSLQPSDLPTGQYKLDIVVYSAGEVAQKKTSTFFVVGEGWRIAGIKSYPPVITSTAQVLLKAELELPSEADPYLRWSWKGKAFSTGLLSKGTGQTLWTAPPDEGVYTIRLELFPSTPAAGTDFPFSSSLSMTTDVYVSSGGKSDKKYLGADSSYLSLLYLQASLEDTGTGAKKAGKPEAVPIGSPEVVAVDEGFGYRLEGKTGFEIQWLALPMDDGVLRPFTVSVGVTFEDFKTDNAVFKAATSDESFSIGVSVDEKTRIPIAVLAGGKPEELTIPWEGQELDKDARHLLSLSIVPQAKTLSAQWFLDGQQVSAFTAEYVFPGIKSGGKIVLGGEKGFTGILDEFGIFVRDSQGRPSTDPDLYRRAAGRKYGEKLVLAEGFDGIFLPAGFRSTGKTQLGSGSLSVSAESRIELPAVKIGGDALDFRVELSRDSSKAPVLRFLWEGNELPALEIPVNAESNELRFTFAADGQTVSLPEGWGGKSFTLSKTQVADARLVVGFVNQKEAKGPLIIDQLIALKAKKE
jgi:hypothetical protein